MTNHSNHLKRISFLLFFSVFMFGCIFPGNDTTNSQPDLAEKVQEYPVSNPKEARDAVLIYIRDNYGFYVPMNYETWLEENITPEGVIGSSGRQYTYGNWVISIIFPVTSVENTNYTILLTNPGLRLFWEGEVNALGVVTESSASTNYLPEGAFNDSEGNTPTPSITPTPRNALVNFSDESYRLSFEYPSAWLLTVVQPGHITSNGAFAAKTVKLTKDGMTIKIQYKLSWESTELGDRIPEGEIQVHGLATLLGQEIPQHVIVQEGKDKLLFFGNDVDDISYHFRLETRDVELLESAMEDIVKIAGSLTRTGDIFHSPTPTLTPSITPVPSPTSKFESSRSGGSGSGVSEDCNIAEFISHQTVPEGALIPPGAQFIKSWRIKNLGTCTWDQSYIVAFSDGELMGASESNAFDDEEVLPGGLTNVSVEFTAPNEVGEYESYWVLNDPSGYWFGIGQSKRGLLPVIINVAVPDILYEYDFAWNYCDADWTSGGTEKGDDGEDKESTNKLKCPSSSSASGSVLLQSNPVMEHRLDDELTLAVHPYETRYGWIKGTYPEFTVKSGDRFKTWVGCMAEMNMCAIDFRLSYIDSQGTTHLIDTWFEDFNGQATEIEIDLSFLDGQIVRFVLETVAMTHNTHKAYGFWFVPRIERP